MDWFTYFICHFFTAYSILLCWSHVFIITVSYLNCSQLRINANISIFCPLTISPIFHPTPSSPGTNPSATRQASSSTTATSSTSISSLSRAGGNSKTSLNPSFVDLTDSNESVAVAGAKPPLGGGAGQSTQTPATQNQNQNQNLSSGSVTPAHGTGFDPSEVMLIILYKKEILPPRCLIMCCYYRNKIVKSKCRIIHIRSKAWIDMICTFLALIFKIHFYSYRKRWHKFFLYFLSFCFIFSYYFWISSPSSAGWKIRKVQIFLLSKSCLRFHRVWVQGWNQRAYRYLLTLLWWCWHLMRHQW